MIRVEWRHGHSHLACCHGKDQSCSCPRIDLNFPPLFFCSTADRRRTKWTVKLQEGKVQKKQAMWLRYWLDTWPFISWTYVVDISSVKRGCPYAVPGAALGRISAYPLNLLRDMGGERQPRAKLLTHVYTRPSVYMTAQICNIYIEHVPEFSILEKW